MVVWDSPPQCGVVEVLWGRPEFQCGLTVVGMLCLNLPGMVTVPKWKYPVVRVQMRGVKWDQLTGRWLVKAWRKLSLNSV